MQRSVLMALVLVMSVLAVGFAAAYMHERSRSPGVEIQLDGRGLRIDGH